MTYVLNSAGSLNFNRFEQFCADGENLFETWSLKLIFGYSIDGSSDHLLLVNLKILFNFSSKSKIIFESRPFRENNFAIALNFLSTSVALLVFTVTLQPHGLEDMSYLIPKISLSRDDITDHRYSINPGSYFY